MSGTDSLASAALAFDANMGNTSVSSKDDGDSGDSRPVESMFGNLGELDPDSDIAGGDELPIKGEARQRREKRDEGIEELSSGDEEANEGLEDGEEGDEESVPDEEEVDEDDKKDDEDEDDVYEVQVDGERVEVPLKEALEGYIRTETFHRRLNALNEVKETVRNEAVKVVEMRQKYTHLVKTMQENLDLIVPKEPDWSEVYANNPPEVAKKIQQDYAAYKTHREALDEAAAKAAKEQEEEDAANMADYVRQENIKILNNFPAWKDDKVREKDLQAMADTAYKAGFTKEEVLQTKDSRMITILNKAMKYDRLQANKPKPIRRGKTPVKPGAGSKSTAPKVGKAQQQLRRTGSIEDAANVFTNIIRRK